MKKTTVNYEALKKLKEFIPEYMKIIDLVVHNSWLVVIIISPGSSASGVTFRIKNI